MVTFIWLISLVVYAVSLDPDSLLKFALEQTTQTTHQLIDQKQLGKEYPTNSKNSTDDKQIWETTGPSGWTSGFFPGILWHLYNYTQDNTLREYAENTTEGLSSEQHNVNTHDVGFIIFCSFGTGFLISQNQSYHKVILTAADSLSTRYSSIVGCIRSWNGPHFQVIIDNMMNLELLWWASQNGDSHTYFDMATSHADHMIRDCIKPDGSSYHLIDYDPNTGAVLSKTNTPQGYPDGVWSRGEAWALYGFTMSYRYSKFQRYLDTAINVANYFISHLPDDFIPLWDFKAPSSLPQRDTSAAAVAASGLLELSTYVSADLSAKYKQASVNILTSLGSAAYMGDPNKTDAMLLHGCEGYQAPCDVSLIYGDYYFVEALLRYKNMS